MLSFEFGGDLDNSIVSLDLHVRIVVVVSLDITFETNSNVVRVNSDFNASRCLKDFSTSFYCKKVTLMPMPESRCL